MARSEQDSIIKNIEKKSILIFPELEKTNIVNVKKMLKTMVQSKTR